MQLPTKIFHYHSQYCGPWYTKVKINTATRPKAINKSNTTNNQTMQIPKIFHYHSQYYVHYKSYKGRQEEREREREWEREIETQTDFPEQKQKQNKTSQNS